MRENAGAACCMARCLPGSRVVYHPARPREEEREECWEGKVWAAGAAASVRRGPFLRSPLTGLPLSGDYFKIAVFRRPLVSEENRQKQHRQKSPLSSRIKSDGEIILALPGTRDLSSQFLVQNCAISQ